VPIRAGFRTLILAIAAAALVAVAMDADGAVPSTTGPELIVPMRVTLTNAGIRLNAAPRVDLETTILFLVTNQASGPRWFEIGTSRTQLRRTPLLRRAATYRFYYVFRVRGSVPFRSGGPGAVIRTGTIRVV
jgi:hypothetical protein